MKRKHKYWIRFYWSECPVCGADKSFHERIYGRKPKSVTKRHILIPDRTSYGYCNVL